MLQTHTRTYIEINKATNREQRIGNEKYERNKIAIISKVGKVKGGLERIGGRIKRDGASKEYARRQEDWSGAREIKQLVTLHRGSSQRDLIMFSV